MRTGYTQGTQCSYTVACWPEQDIVWRDCVVSADPWLDYSGTPLLWTPWGPSDVCSGTPLLWTPWGPSDVYSGTPLLWTPWGLGEVSCIERCPHFRDKFLLRKHIWDIAKCPQYRGVLILGATFKRGSTLIS